MSKFRIALIQLKVTENKAKNVANAVAKIRQAATEGRADVVVLPECFNSPYGNAYFANYAEPLERSETLDAIGAVARESRCTVVAGSIPTINEHQKLYNTSVTFDGEGKRVATFHKVHLFDIDVPGKIRFFESESLSPGNKLATFKLPQSEATIGVGICFDVRFAEMAHIYAQRGCNVLIYPGAFNTTTGPLHWELLARARAVDNQLYTVMCSPARDLDATYHAWGHSLVVDPWGKVIAEATGDEQGEQIVYADIDLSVVDAFRQQVPTIRNKRHDLYTVQDKSE